MNGELVHEIDRTQNMIAEVRNQSYRLRRLVDADDHYTSNLSKDADGCLAGAIAIYDMVLKHLEENTVQA